MKPEAKSTRLLGVTRSKAKMIEYNVPESEQSIDLTVHPTKLFTISISLLGSLSALINRSGLTSFTDEDYRNNLRFSAYFFDAFLKSGLDNSASSYTKLLGSAAYYLADTPGSAMVLARQFGSDTPDLDGSGLEELLLWLLRGDYSTYFHENEGLYWEYIDIISQFIHSYFNEGKNLEGIIKYSDQLRRVAYRTGSPRELLLADIATAIIKKKINNSSWYSIPNYSKLSLEQWENVLKKDSFIKELWPSQHLLGVNGVFAGKSAVVQMPTSAGKTKATEIIIRSAFLDRRASMAVIVAPFRALCHEIQKDFSQAFDGEGIKVSELSDAYQADYDIEEILSNKYVLVATPEKLLYILRQSPEIASSIGLIVLDEGHQFDTGIRGVTYELLLTSLRMVLPNEAQKVLISAVIKNAQEIGEWINGEDFVIASGDNLLPTYRSYGLASWSSHLGQIHYLPSSKNDYAFFVPRVLEAMPLELRGRERIEKKFPNKGDSVEIALFLGLKLIKNGSVAIYCGKKASAAKVCNIAVDCFERNLDMDFPKNFSDETEVARLSYLYSQNLGESSKSTQSAKLGVFAHHANTPHGIRLAVEHAMRDGLIRFVACTSTLAQGVNLPIRYLLVTGDRQGKDRIKVRDFHNLIGRVGRASMHTEGSVIFTQTKIIDKKGRYGDQVRRDTSNLLNPANSESCESSLLDIFPPVIKNDPYKTNFAEYVYTGLSSVQLTQLYINNDSYDDIISSIFDEFKNEEFDIDNILKQLKYFSNILTAIECFIMSHATKSIDSLRENTIKLAKETLAYFLSDNDTREEIIAVFLMLANHILEKKPSVALLKSYGKTFYPSFKSQKIREWVDENFYSLLDVKSNSEFIELVWDIFLESVDITLIKNCTSPDIMLESVKMWLRGDSFDSILDNIEHNEAKKIQKTQIRSYSIDDIVDICESGLAYHGSLFFSTLCEFFDEIGDRDTKKQLSSFKLFQKKIKYGLPTKRAVILYELGFRDRVVAQDIAKYLGKEVSTRSEILESLAKDKEQIKSVIDKYPLYFHFQLENVDR